MTELESEFEKHKNGPKAVPEKLVRSEQAKAKVAVEAPEGGEGDAAAAAGENPEHLQSPFEICSTHWTKWFV